MIEDVAEIAAVNPAAAGQTPNEVLGLVLWRIAHSPAEDGPAWNHRPPILLRLSLHGRRFGVLELIHRAISAVL